MKRCYHEQNNWLIAGAEYEWCYGCGALRKMRTVAGTNNCYPLSRWIRPTHNKENNPFDELKKPLIRRDR